MKKVFLGLLAVMVGIVMIGCQNPVDVSNKGSLTITVGDSVSRSINPAISMEPASYVISGSGPGGATFTQTITGSSSVTIESLVCGDWTITVTAKNASGTDIGTGTGTAAVNPASSSTVNISVRPFDGFGTLNLALSWPASQVQIAGVVSSLLPATGAARSLNFTVNGTNGTASFSATDVQTGYHTLTLKLYDNGFAVMGAVEVVRIVKDQISSGTFAFDNINPATGSIDVNLTPDMGDPLLVAISGAAATKTEAETVTVSASVTNFTGNVIYVWYVNGNAVGTGAAFAFNTTWIAGYYRIDVTAFNSDGKRAGSATTNVEVVANNDYTSANIGTLKYVPAGSFQRDATATNISTITTAYRMSQYEITRTQFLAIMGTDPSFPGYSSGMSDPVQQANWYHAIAFCNKLSIAEGLTPVYSISVGGNLINFATLTYDNIPTISNADWNAATSAWTNNGYRLPTEMEWMWAAMGATSDRSNSYLGIGTNTTGYTKGYAGSTEAFGAQVNIGNYAWYNINSDIKTHPVGTAGTIGYPNELELYDMSGNVHEWCWDWGTSSYTGTVTSDSLAGKGVALGTSRMAHGGSWATVAAECALFFRMTSFVPTSQSITIGFRVVRP